jgi:hypothetical protein
MTLAPTAVWRCCTATILALAIISAWPAAIHAQPRQPDGDSDRVNAQRASRVLKEMQTLVRALKIVEPARPEDPIKLIEEPLFRHNGLARSYEDGSTWAWGARGRPMAFCKLFTFDSDEGFGITAIP